MEILIKVLGAAAITILFVTSEPTNRIKELMGFTAFDNQGWKGFLSRLMNCCMCSGFWVGLILTQDIYLAAIVAITAEFINNKL